MTAITSKPDHGASLGIVGGDEVFASDEFQIYLDEIEQRLNARLLGLAVRLPSRTVADLPPAGKWGASVIYVSDESGGAVLAFSDGSNWRRVTDRAVVS